MTRSTALLLLALGGSSALADPPAEPAAGPQSYRETIPDTDVSFDMIGIPPGVARIGSPNDQPGRRDDEGPVIEVRFEPFWIGRCEVTWGEYRQFMKEWDIAMADPNKPRAGLGDPGAVSIVSIPSEMRGLDMVPVFQAMGSGDRYPATFMTQYAARQYCKWLSLKTGRFYRLPTEAEWEYAARAGSRSAWSFGDDPSALGNHAWTIDNSAWDDPDRGHPDTGSGYREVASLKPNAWGLHDMHGNVAEWCIDAYAPDRYQQIAKQIAVNGGPVDASAIVNWPTAIHPRVLRGGHWDSEARDTRSASRLASTPDWSEREPSLPKSLFWHVDAPFVGLRVVRPAKEPTEAKKLRYWDAQCDEMRDLLKAHNRLLRIKFTPPEKPAPVKPLDPN